MANFETTEVEKNERLIEEATNRIVTADTLDGFILPPDNDELYDPRPITAHRAGEPPHTYTPTLTNSYVRKVNIRSIAHTGRPLLMRNDDPDHLRKMREWQERDQQRRQMGVALKLRRLIFG
jgi:hypothetical protein